MILTKEVKVYSKMVKIKDLPLNSHKKIKVKCYNCGNIKEVVYQSYNTMTNNNKDKYYCNKKECVNKKRKKIIQKKYGVDNVFQLDEIKDKIKKSNLDLYGVENPQQNDEIKIKTEKTNLKKYGSKNPFQSEIIKKKIKNTNLKKYGVEYPQQNKKIRSKTYSGKPSKNENELRDFIKNNYNGEIITSSRNIIIGKELDIYLPELKLAFEFNGLYWHNETKKPKNYHLNKTDECDKLGIQLIHIFEDDWDYKKDIVKSMVINKLNKTPNKIFARKCQIKNIVDNKLVKKFLNDNHLQGYINSSVKIGLFFNNELVSVMTFGKKRKIMNSTTNNNDYEMYRFCNKINTNIIGGTSKLFKYFLNNFDVNEVISYVDRSYFNGNNYIKLGFILDSKTEPNYYYIINKKREYRFKYRKNILVKEGYDINKSEHQIMLDRKIYRIYNSGNYKMIYKK